MRRLVHIARLTNRAIKILLEHLSKILDILILMRYYLETK